MPTRRGTSRSRFLCPSGSRAGRMIPARPARKSGMYSGAVNTAWSYTSACGFRKSQAARVRRVAASRPIWQRKTARTSSSRRRMAPRAERLRVVDHQQVARPDERPQRRGVLAADRVVDRPVVRRQPRIPAAVDQIVQALGQREELGLVGADHRPLHVHAELAQNRDHARHHLRDPASARRRVDHPDRTALQVRHERARLGA